MNQPKSSQASGEDQRGGDGQVPEAAPAASGQTPRDVFANYATMADASAQKRLEPSADENKPFRLAKKFILVASIAILLVLMGLVVWVTTQAEAIISKRVEDDTIKLMGNLNRQMSEDFLKPAWTNFKGIKLSEPIQQTLLHNVIQNTVYGFDIQKVVIYSMNGLVVYASDQKLLGTQKTEDLSSFKRAIELFESVPRQEKFYHLPFNFELWRELNSPRQAPQRPVWIFKPLAPGWSPERSGDQGSGLYPDFFNRTWPFNPPAAERAESGGQKEKAEAAVGGQSQTLNPGELSDLKAMVGPASNEYLEYLRTRTVLNYEGGSFLFWKFFPQGNFILRCYMVMEFFETGGPSGILEINRDLSAEYDQIFNLHVISLLVAMLLAAILIIFLYRVVRRGEKEIHRQHLQQQLLRSRLEQSERLAGLGSMVATVAHEIRNPLGIIHSAADLLSRFLSKDPLKSKEAELAETIVVEGNRLSDVVNEFLDFARPPQIKPTMVLVEDVLEEVLASLELKLSRAGVELSQSFQPEPTPIKADAARLHRVFLNLMVNAIDAMSDGGLLTVTTSRENEGRTLLVTISDTGPGLPPEAKNKIFTPFYTTKAKGTGLGLVIVRKIIEAHGGSLELVNNPPPQNPEEDEGGPGLTVFIRLNAEPRSQL